MHISLRCPTCNGYADRTNDGLIQTIYECRSCGTTIFAKRCRQCSGSGYYRLDPCPCNSGIQEIVYVNKEKKKERMKL